LTSPFTADQLIDLLAKLLMRPRQLLRTSEAQYKALQLDDLNQTDSALIDAMIKHPQLIERPIVVIGDRAVIGRPPENILALLA
jgi:arsenate reductase